MRKNLELLIRISNHIWGHVLFGLLVVLIWHGVAHRGYNLASPIETGSIMLVSVVWLGISRLVLIFLDVRERMRPGIGLIVYWVLFGWMFVEHGESLINAHNLLWLPILYIACHSSDVGVRMAMSSIERWWGRLMADDPQRKNA